MIYLRSIMACDRRTTAISIMTNNLDEVPNWIAGNSLSLSKWSIDITHIEDTITLTNLSYPVNIHIDTGSIVTLQNIKLYRMVGNEELYFDITPTESTGQIFDFHFEFIEKSDQ